MRVSLKPARNFEEAQQLMFEEVPKTKRNVFMRAGSLERSKAFFELLGNPQDNHATIHVAATSGKGSISNIIDALLLAHGKTTCLHVSPHVYDVRERLAINGGLISEEKFVEYMNDLIPAFEDMSETQYGRPTYYEVSTALGFLAADDAKIDYTVLETGLGGLYDSSNSISRGDKFSIIGRIGMDHVPILANPAELVGTEAKGLLPTGTESLPTDIERIAVQKAGIMSFGGQAVALRQDPAVDAVIQSIADFRKTKLQWVTSHEAVKYEYTDGVKTIVTLDVGDHHWEHVSFNLPGTHQLENLSLALTAVAQVAERDGWQLNEAAVRKALDEVWLPGRFEVRSLQQKTIILDGSHNPQKMQALVETFQRAYRDKKAVVVMAMNKAKDAGSVIKLLEPITENLICTDFFTNMQDFLHKAYKPERLAEIARENLDAPVITAATEKEAIQQAMASDNDLILITGSFYFLGEINDILKSYES